jgi:superfamily II DNA or RNA helicase
MAKKEIRKYQLEAMSAVKDAMSKGETNLLMVLPTGAGKTFTCAKTIKDLGKCLWISHLEELIEQSAIALFAELELLSYNELLFTIKNAGGLLELLTKANRRSDGMFFQLTPQELLISETIGVVKADLFDIDKPICMASVQTLWRRLDKIPPNHFEVVVADEAHLFGAKTFQACLNHFTPKLRLGLTATPFREDNMLVGDIFDSIVYEYTIDQAIKDKFLTQPDAIQIKTSADLDSVHTSGGDFKTGELVEVVNSLTRNNLIVNKYIEYANGRQFIAFCVDVQHAQDLCDAFKEKGINCDFIVGDKKLTTDRRGTIERFKSGETTGLTNCMVLTAGFDHSDTGCVILACPTKSKAKFLQSLGRGLRLKSDEFVSKYGQNVIILDVVDNTSKHKLINTFTLDKDLPVEKKVFISEKNRQMLLDVKFKREHSFSTVQRLQDVKVDLFQLPPVVISDSMRMKEDATPAQLKWIADLGYDVVGVHYSKKMCSEIISLQSASDAQIWRLKQEGYDMSNGCTVSQAKSAFLEIEARKQAEQLKSQTQNFNLPFNL